MSTASDGSGGRGPGIRKAGPTATVVRRRRLELYGVVDGAIADLFARADVMSEGEVRTEDRGLVYYGTTSILVPDAAHGGTLPVRSVPELCLVLRHDPHTRVRARRIARREAQSRAGGSLGVLRADVQIDAGVRGLLLSIDVEATVARAATSATS